MTRPPQVYCTRKDIHQGCDEQRNCADGTCKNKGVGVSLLVAETTGALAASFMTILRLLARQTRLPGATDNTRYGEGRASPRSFLTHHVANISTAIQTTDAQTILNAASARMLRVSFGVM